MEDKITIMENKAKNTKRWLITTAIILVAFGLMVGVVAGLGLAGIINITTYPFWKYEWGRHIITGAVTLCFGYWIGIADA